MVCYGSFETFYVHSDAGLHYEWTIPGTSMKLWLQTDTALMVMLDPLGGFITVTVTNACIPSLTDYFLVTVNFYPDTSITANGGTLTANATFGNYQWVECPAMTAINGATSWSFTPLVSGNYAVVVDGGGGCIDTSNCHSVIVAGVLTSDNLVDEFQISPNPTTNNFTLKNISSNETSLLHASATLSIINPIGEIVYTEKLFGKNEYVVDADFAKGIYFVRVSDGEKSVVRKLIVQ
jgi:hypothetical protein